MDDRGATDSGQHQPSNSKAERRHRYRRGLSAELVAGLFLRAKGYRVLARRFKTPLGEIDLIACRGNRLAFIEVKRRRSMAAAEAAISPRQRERIRRSAELWLARSPAHRNCDISFDVIFLLPYHWPRHIVGGL